MTTLNVNARNINANEMNDSCSQDKTSRVGLMHSKTSLRVFQEKRRSKNTIEHKKTLKKDAEKYKPVVTNDICASSIEDLMHKLLSKFDGVLVGEFHNKTDAKKFIIKQLEMGTIETLFMEQFFENMQQDLDIYIRGGPLSQELENHLINGDRHFAYRGSDCPYSFRGILKKAQEMGVRVVAIDSRIANVPDEQNRWKLMNLVASEIIKREYKGGKFLALMGLNHLNNHTQQFPGVSELTGNPSITFSDLGQKAIVPNFVWETNEKKYP